MRNKLKNHHMITLILCVTVLFTMGLDYGATTKNYDQTTSNLSVENDSSNQIRQYKRSNKIQSDPLESSERALRHMQLAMKYNNYKRKYAEVSTSNYEVTAYFLNVRAEANSSSKIIDVVAKGSMLEVMKPTDNGWLALKSGGFVHGKYARLIGEAVKQYEKVTVLSVEQSDVTEAVTPSPQAMNESAAPVKPTSIVESDSGLTEEHIAKIFEGTALEGEGLEKVILDVEKNYGINSYFTIAVMKLESGHGKSRIARNKNNLFGLNATGDNPYNKALSFRTKGDSVQKFGHIISEYYLDKGLTSVDKVAQKYCKANPKWPTLVKSIMKSDYKKLAA